jgi:catechol 2,3-dioxygenase-like lactoylglutathione lyase family enzyme
VLSVLSIDEAKEFYVDLLGFAFDWGNESDPAGPPAYAQISRSGTTLHLRADPSDAKTGATVFVRMTGIDALHRAL